jgi:hypothetical protein
MPARTSFWNSIASTFGLVTAPTSTDLTLLGSELSAFGKYRRWNLAGRAQQDWEGTFFRHTEDLIEHIQLLGSIFVIHCWMMDSKPSDASLK